ncbi:MAG: NfeD family protein [Pirellulales bacterium]
MEPWGWSIVLFLLALAIIALELFVPSGGVLAVLATLSVIGSVVTAFMSGWSTGVTMTLVVIVVIPLVVASALRWWPHTPIGQKILNTPPEDADEVLPENDPRYELRELIGSLAVAKTKMLPSGIVSIGGRTFDAVAEGQAIEPGEMVRVVGVDLNRLEVRLVTDATAGLADAPGRRVRPSGDDVLAKPLEDLGLEPLDDSTKVV